MILDLVLPSFTTASMYQDATLIVSSATPPVEPRRRQPIEKHQSLGGFSQQLQRLELLFQQKLQEGLAQADTLKAKLAQIEKTHQDLVTRHSSLVSERDHAAKERDALKKIASERAMRIAELEAQLADQAERQRQIDEEMAKAEGQLDILKQILTPAPF
jgi:chromosome segregation ATPase